MSANFHSDFPWKRSGVVIRFVITEQPYIVLVYATDTEWVRAVYKSRGLKLPGRTSKFFICYNFNLPQP